MTKRACRSPGCITILSVSNKGPFCWTHTPDVGSKLTSSYKRPMRTTSEAYVENIVGASDFTAEDRRRYKRGGGA